MLFVVKYGHAQARTSMYPPCGSAAAAQRQRGGNAARFPSRASMWPRARTGVLFGKV